MGRIILKPRRGVMGSKPLFLAVLLALSFYTIPLAGHQRSATPAGIERHLQRRDAVNRHKVALKESAMSTGIEATLVRIGSPVAPFQFASGDYVAVSGMLGPSSNFSPTGAIFFVSPSGSVTSFEVPVVVIPVSVAFDATRRRVVVASVSRLLVIDLLDGSTRQVFGFSYASGVAVAGNGDIFVTDLGRDFFGETPDGVIYRIDPESLSRRRVAVSHRWISPAYLDFDRDGKLLVLDGEAVPSADDFPFPWDGIFSVDPISEAVTPVYQGPGIIGTALGASGDGSIWVASVSAIGKVDPKQGTFTEYCEGIFFFADGIQVDTFGNLIVTDGSSLTPPRYHAIDRIRNPSLPGQCDYSTVVGCGLLPGGEGLDIVP